MKSFLELLDMQRELDEKINSCRPRTVEDIKLSMIAEVIEWNEETPLSHKTWKSKEIDNSKMNEELIDVFFFYLQFANKIKDNIEEHRKEELEHLFKIISKFFEKWEEEVYIITDEDGNIKESDKMWNIFALEYIQELTDPYIDDVDLLESLLIQIVGISWYQGMSKEDFVNTYVSKWEKNITRIKSEWN